VLDKSIASRYWPERQYPASVTTDCLAPSVLPEACRQLRSKGYRESAIRAIMSGNFMRVASGVWAT
jgi:microsomal dipeptidase-like Zn-dependent dipeptidase